MPCYDPRGNEQVVYVNGVSPDLHRAELINLKDSLSKLEAGLCAIITELESIGLANSILAKASRSGKIDLMTFWSEHSKQDESRLSKKFHQFSEHEQNLIKDMIKDGKL